MSSLWIAVLALSAPPPSDAPPQSAGAVPAVTTKAAADAPALEGRALAEAIHASLRRWARPNKAEAPQAARELLGLYQDLLRDTKLGGVARQSLRSTLRLRLARLSEQIARQVAKDRPAAKDVRGPADRAAAMAQWPAAMQPGMGRRGFGPMGGAVNAAAMGGFPAGVGPQAGEPDDNGQALVELIQRTIAPDTWDVNGGNGAIYYWHPGHAMVITNTDEVHDQVGGVLRQLQRAQ